MKTNPVVWFEVPVADMARAKAFYEKTFDIEIKVMDFGELKMGWFPINEQAPGASGSLVQQDSYVPSYEGTLVYFASEDIQTELDRIEDAGGKILKEKTQISPEYGCMALFEDSEGNRIALHSDS